MKKIIFPFLIVCFLVISFLPTWYELGRRHDLPSDRSFELVHNYITDYNFYLSRIREGWEGRTTVVERYTSEPHDGSLVQEFYLGLGQLGRGITDSQTAPAIIYHIAVFVFACALLSLTAWAATQLFSSLLWSVLAFVVAVTACGWPIFVMVSGAWRIGGYMSWFTVLDTILRITFLPHVLAGQACIIALLFLASRDRVFASSRYRFFLGILALVLGMIFPPGLVFVDVTLGVVVAMETLWGWKRYIKARRFFLWWEECVWPRLAIVLVSLPALLYYVSILQIYPWKRLVEFDQQHPLRVSIIEYAKALGPVLPLGLCGLVIVLLNKEKRFIAASAWVVAWMVLFFLFTFIPQQSPLRFAEMAPHIPLAFLSLFACFSVIQWTARRHRTLYLGIAAMTIPFLLILLGAATLYSNWLWHKDFIDLKVEAGWPAITMNNYIVYPTKAFKNGIWYTATLPETAVILSGMTAGNYIPAYTGKTVYVGHDNTIDLDAKKRNMEAFYNGTTSSKDAYWWVKTMGITHVFVGPQEKEYALHGAVHSHYPFLHILYDEDGVAIYEVQ